MTQNGAYVSRKVFRKGPSRSWRIGLGGFTILTGVVILAWPGAAIVTIAIIVGVHLVVAGVVLAGTAFAREKTARLLYFLLGVLLVLAGLLCFRSPFHATTLLVVLFGVTWLVNGVVELFHGLTGGGGWVAVAGAVSVVAGVAVLAYPAPGARVLVWLFGVSLLAIGLAELVGALAESSARTRR